jgi:hypothetical protein
VQLHPLGADNEVESGAGKIMQLEDLLVIIEIVITLLWQRRVPRCATFGCSFQR